MQVVSRRSVERILLGRKFIVVAFVATLVLFVAEVVTEDYWWALSSLVFLGFLAALWASADKPSTPASRGSRRAKG